MLLFLLHLFQRRTYSTHIRRSYKRSHIKDLPPHSVSSSEAEGNLCSFYGFICAHFFSFFFVLFHCMVKTINSATAQIPPAHATAKNAVANILPTRSPISAVLIVPEIYKLKTNLHPIRSYDGTHYKKSEASNCW